MRTAFHHAAVAAFLATGLVAGAWGQMQTPSDPTAPNGARVPPEGGSALPPGPPGVRVKPGDPLPPPRELTPNAPRYAETPSTATPPGAAPGTPPSTTEQGNSRARTPQRAHPSEPAAVHRGDMGTRNATRGGINTRDLSNFPTGLRQCADMADRDERARCASELYDDNGQPRR